MYKLFSIIIIALVFIFFVDEARPDTHLNINNVPEQNVYGFAGLQLSFKLN